MNKIVGHIEGTYPYFCPYICAFKTFRGCSLFSCHKQMGFFFQFYRFSNFYMFVGFVWFGFLIRIAKLDRSGRNCLHLVFLLKAKAMVCDVLKSVFPGPSNGYNKLNRSAMDVGCNGCKLS